MKYASIDIGTNTVLLLIMEMDKMPEDILDMSIITRLGEGLKRDGVLTEKAMEKTFSALQEYKTIAESHGVKEIYCVGTNALREARNSQQFLERIKEELGISVRVITEYEEAYYTYLSIKHDKAIKAEEYLIVDIGGGSTEIIKGNRNRFIDYVSLPVGSVKLTEMFIKNDPPEEYELKALNAFLKDCIKTPFDGKGCAFIGTAGTITTLASLYLGLEKYDKNMIHGLKISQKEISGIIERLQSLTVSERREIPGMEKGREDIIFQGIILLSRIMSYFDAKELIVNTHGVRYGVIYEILGK